LQLLVLFKLHLPLWRRVEHFAILSENTLINEACKSYILTISISANTWL